MPTKTRASLIRAALESDILAGVLAPGMSVDEEQLAARFSVSRTPIREAMMQLLHDGLLDKEARRGMRIAKLDLRRLIQVFETTSELEGLCARLAARRMTKKEQAELEKEHELGERALEAADGAVYAGHGRRFHYLVIRGTHNDSLIEAVNRVALHTFPYRRFQLRYPGRARANHEDHSLILQAIVNGDEQSAYDRMCKHVTVQGDVLAEYISVQDRVREAI